MTNPSTIWAALALPLTPVGDIPFVGLDGVSIQTDAVGFFYTQPGAPVSGSLFPQQLTVLNGFRVHYLDQTSLSGVVFHLNAVAGRVNIPVSATQVTVNNTFVDANSIIHLQAEANDATCTKLWVSLRMAGSFNISGNALPTNPLPVAFTVTNVF